MIDGVVREATSEEVLQLTNTLEQPTAPAEPTKEELLAELQALTAKINALG